MLPDSSHNEGNCYLVKLYSYHLVKYVLEHQSLIFSISVTSSHESISRAALLALQLLEVGFSKQEAFITLLKRHSSVAREVNVTPLDELMMGINPQSGQADHLINYV